MLTCGVLFAAEGGVADAAAQDDRQVQVFGLALKDGAHHRAGGSYRNLVFQRTGQVSTAFDGRQQDGCDSQVHTAMPVDRMNVPMERFCFFHSFTIYFRIVNT
jgi:hypothetical protein